MSKSVLLLSRSQRNKTCLHANRGRCFSLPFHSTEISAIFQCLFALDSSQAASGSHVANAVFVRMVPTVISHGNGGKVGKCVL